MGWSGNFRKFYICATDCHYQTVNHRHSHSSMLMQVRIQIALTLYSFPILSTDSGVFAVAWGSYYLLFLICPPPSKNVRTTFWGKKKCTKKCRTLARPPPWYIPVICRDKILMGSQESLDCTETMSRSTRLQQFHIFHKHMTTPPCSPDISWPVRAVAIEDEAICYQQPPVLQSQTSRMAHVKKNEYI